MLEYLTRLTADIVTGKVDVQDASAHLPDVPVADPPQGLAISDLDLEPSEGEASDE
jgi:hypothetical protein